MNKLVALLISLIAYLHVAEAGSKKLSRNQNLSWTFVGSDSVTFTYTIPESEGKNYDYWGLGFQASGSSGMRGDIITVSKTKGVLDTFATGNAIQIQDSKNNLTNTSLKVVSGKYVATWTRKLDTGDSKDMKLVKGTTYRLIWAFGKQSSSGKWIQHAKKDYGKDTFKLNDSSQRRLTEEEFESWEQGIYDVQDEDQTEMNQEVEIIDEDNTSVYMITSFILLFTYIIA
jgi:hypothetical protein